MRLSILCLLAIASVAQAGNTSPTPKGGDTHVKTTIHQSARATANSQSRSAAKADSTSTAESNSASQQSQTAAGGNASGGDASQSQTNAGNSLSVSNRDRLQAPAISAPPIYASNSCATGWSAGATVPGFGVSGGRAKPDANCDRREVARILMGINPALALKVLCADPYVKEVSADLDCVYQPPIPTAAVSATQDLSQPPAEAPPYATKEELERAFKQSQAK